MIRPAEPADFYAMETLFYASAGVLCLDAYGEETIAAWTRKPRIEKMAHLAENGVDYYLLLRHGKIACFGSLNLSAQVIDALFVHPDHAGQKLGQEMIEFLFAKAAATGVEELGVEASLNAAAFYARNGFVEQELTLVDLGDRFSMEAVLMRRSGDSG